MRKNLKFFKPSQSPIYVFVLPIKQEEYEETQSSLILQKTPDSGIDELAVVAVPMLNGHLKEGDIVTYNKNYSGALSIKLDKEYKYLHENNLIKLDSIDINI